MVDRVNFYKKSPAMFFSESPPKPKKSPQTSLDRGLVAVHELWSSCACQRVDRWDAIF